MNREIKFGTDGWRAIIAKDFTVENVMRVAKATADWMLRHYANPSVLVGFDCRFGGSLFAQTAINVFCANNIKVFYDTHFVTTPMVSLGTKQLGCELGIIFTASHNPPAYNGYKIKSKHGGPLIQKHIAEIEELVPDKYEVDEKSLDHWHELQMLEYVDLETMYF
jgi:phosphomannomutase